MQEYIYSNTNGNDWGREVLSRLYKWQSFDLKPGDLTPELCFNHSWRGCKMLSCGLRAAGCGLSIVHCQVLFGSGVNSNVGGNHLYLGSLHSLWWMRQYRSLNLHRYGVGTRKGVLFSNLDKGAPDELATSLTVNTNKMLVQFWGS